MFAICWRVSVLLSVMTDLYPSIQVDALVCEDADVAATQLETYYSWWYRFWNMLKTSRICRLGDEDRKTVCANVARACFEDLRKFAVKELIKAIRTPGKCSKRTFVTPLSTGGSWSRRKMMYFCDAYSIKEEKVASFFVSGAGQTDAALIFNTVSEENSDIELVRLVTGLGLRQNIIAKEREDPAKNTKEPDKNTKEPIKNTEEPAETRA